MIAWFKTGYTRGNRLCSSLGETTGSRQSTYLVRQAALELTSHNITVNAIAPGAFATNIGGGRLKLPEVNQGG